MRRSVDKKVRGILGNPPKKEDDLLLVIVLMLHKGVIGTIDGIADADIFRDIIFIFGMLPKYQFFHLLFYLVNQAAAAAA